MVSKVLTILLTKVMLGLLKNRLTIKFKELLIGLIYKEDKIFNGLTNKKEIFKVHFKMLEGKHKQLKKAWLNNLKQSIKKLFINFLVIVQSLKDLKNSKDMWPLNMIMKLKKFKEELMKKLENNSAHQLLQDFHNTKIKTQTVKDNKSKDNALKNIHKK